MKNPISVLVISTMLASMLISACSNNSEPRSGSPEPIEKESVIAPVEEEQTPAPKIVYTDGLKDDGKIHVYLIGDGEKVYTPESSFIDYLIYYAESKHLIISMNGKEYTFANISESTWEDFKAADSKGKFYNAEIKGNSLYLINDYDGTNGSLIVVENVESR